MVRAMSRGLGMCLDATQRRGARSVEASGVETQDVGIVDLIVGYVSYRSLYVDVLHSGKYRRRCMLKRTSDAKERCNKC